MSNRSLKKNSAKEYNRTVPKSKRRLHGGGIQQNLLLPHLSMGHEINTRMICTPTNNSFPFLGIPHRCCPGLPYSPFLDPCFGTTSPIVLTLPHTRTTALPPRKILFSTSPAGLTGQQYLPSSLGEPLPAPSLQVQALQQFISPSPGECPSASSVPAQTPQKFLHPSWKPNSFLSKTRSAAPPLSLPAFPHNLDLNHVSPKINIIPPPTDEQTPSSEFAAIATSPVKPQPLPAASPTHPHPITTSPKATVEVSPKSDEFVSLAESQPTKLSVSPIPRKDLKELIKRPARPLLEPKATVEVSPKSEEFVSLAEPQPTKLSVSPIPRKDLKELIKRPARPLLENLQIPAETKAKLSQKSSLPKDRPLDLNNVSLKINIIPTSVEQERRSSAPTAPAEPHHRTASPKSDASPRPMSASPRFARRDVKPQPFISDSVFGQPQFHSTAMAVLPESDKFVSLEQSQPTELSVSPLHRKDLPELIKHSAPPLSKDLKALAETKAKSSQRFSLPSLSSDRPLGLQTVPLKVNIISPSVEKQRRSSAPAALTEPHYRTTSPKAAYPRSTSPVSPLANSKIEELARLTQKYRNNRKDGMLNLFAARRIKEQLDSGTDDPKLLEKYELHRRNALDNLRQLNDVLLELQSRGYLKNEPLAHIPENIDGGADIEVEVGTQEAIDLATTLSTSARALVNPPGRLNTVILLSPDELFGTSFKSGEHEEAKREKEKSLFDKKKKHYGDFKRSYSRAKELQDQMLDIDEKQKSWEDEEEKQEMEDMLKSYFQHRRNLVNHYFMHE